MILKDIFSVIAFVLICQQVADGEISSIQSLNKAAIDENSNNFNEPSIDKIYHDYNTASMAENLKNTNSDGNNDNINEASINKNYRPIRFNEDSRGEDYRSINRASIDETHEINAASIDGHYDNINAVSIDGNYNMNEVSMDGSHERSLSEIDETYSDEVSLDRDYPSINEDENSLGESREINAASIDEDYNHLNSLISSSLNDDQFEEKRTIDITKKLKDLGNRITSFFIGDNNYEESYNSFTEATSNTSLENGKHLNEDNRDSIGKNFTEVSKQQNLSELSKKLATPDGRIEVKLDNKKIINDAEIRRGNKNVEERNYHKQDKLVPTGSFKVDSEEIQDAYINAMPLLKQYLTMLSKTEAPNNIYRTKSNPQLRLQEHPGLKRIQGFLKSTNSQLMNGPFPGFRRDSQFLDKFGRKLKGIRYNVK